MPYDPQSAAEAFINPGADPDKIAQVATLVVAIQEQADLHAAESLATIQALQANAANARASVGDARDAAALMIQAMRDGNATLAKSKAQEMAVALAAIRAALK